MKIRLDGKERLLATTGRSWRILRLTRGFHQVLPSLMKANAPKGQCAALYLREAQNQPLQNDLVLAHFKNFTDIVWIDVFLLHPPTFLVLIKVEYL